MSKFDKFAFYLNNKEEDEFTLYFDEIEDILGFELPESAYEYSAYWNPSKTHTLANLIDDCGFRTKVNMNASKITFHRYIYSASKLKAKQKEEKRKIKNLVTEHKVSPIIDKKPLSDIANSIKEVMKKVEVITKDLGYPITESDYHIEDLGCPHVQPSQLPKGYAAVYIFIYEQNNKDEFLKIGKANANSSARFVSQHYGLNNISTLAKSICFDEKFQTIGVTPNNVKEWMLENLHRINIYIKESLGKAITELVESIMHYAYRPRYEGNI